MGAASFSTVVTASLALFAGSASAGRLAAWWTNDYGPTLMMQDDATAGIRYSLCNSRGTPIFPNDTSIVMPLLKFPPKNGTALAGGGWWDSTNVIASIFYFDNSDEVVNTLLKCDASTGHWTNTGDYVISGGAPKAAKNSDLSMDLLGATDGYRVLYNGLDGAVHVLSYNNANGWKYANVAYNATTSANVIASVYPPADLNITLIVPRDKANMGLSRFYGDGTWRIESFPTPLKTLSNNTIITNNTNPSALQLNTTAVPTFTLPAWNGKPKSLAMAEDSSWTRSVFYVGTDKQLYQVGNLDYNWLVFTRPSNTSWPTSDNGYIAVANDFSSSSLRVYYMSNNSLIEANGDKGNWIDAIVLPSYNATASNSTSNNPGASTDGAGSQLSSGAKAGIGVGVTLAVLAIVGIIVAVILLKRRQKRRHEAEAAAAAAAGAGHHHAGDGSTAYGTELGTESKYQSSPATTYTATTPGELHADHTGTTAGGNSAHNYYQNQHYQQPQPTQIYELPEQHNRAEMVGEGHYKEAP